MKSVTTSQKKRYIILLASLFSFLSGNASSALVDLDLSTYPLFLGGGVEPNVMMILDDSGSMHWEYMPDDNWTYFVYPRPDNVYGSSNYGSYVPRFDDNYSYNVRARSPHINKIYYNPAVRYTPWSKYDGTSFGNASPTCAPHNPFDLDIDNDGNSNEVGDDCRNLTVNNTQTANWERYDGNAAGFPGGINTEFNTSKTFYPAVYYKYDGAGDEWDKANYTKVEIMSSVATYTSGANRTDCASAPTCTYAEEIQNFANWYTYYRSRILAARAGIGAAFATLGTNIRVGFSTINDSTIAIGVRKFEDDGNGNGGSDDNYRSDWFTQLYGHSIPTSGTPLREALERAGDYFKITTNYGPWSDDPATGVSGSHLTCRQSYSVLMTDGYRNGSNTGFGNEDSTAGSTLTNDIDGSTYTFPTSNAAPNNTVATAYPYRDAYSDTLADVAMYYWKNDLRTDIDNKISANTADPAFWQHMVTFTVGLGVTGSLDPDTDLPAITAGSTAWPNPNTNATKIDDMWHAAVNSRGEFFSASDPETFADALSDILSNLTSRTTAAASVALNAGSLFSQSTLYQARFDSGNWTGQLLAYPIATDGSVDITTVSWDAGTSGKIPAYSSRKIVTFDGTNGQPFQWANISVAQQTALGSSVILDYIRGSDANEQSNGGGYRNRTTLLGDIIHSSPVYLSAPSAPYFDNWELVTGSTEPEDSEPYSTFRSNNSARNPAIYVGSNAGMLHVIDPDTGEELAAFVPSAVIPNLPNLADPDYAHEYFADGSPTILDAFFNDVDIDSDGNSNEWHTILASGLRGGGQSIFAINVTETPSASDTETTLASRYLWEFDDTDDVDMGYSYSQPNIVRMANGEWAVVFGNGYNNTADDDGDGTTTNDSTTGNAVIYVVDIETGVLIKKFDTGVGYADDPDTIAPNDRPNGMSTVSPIDEDGDLIVDYIYGGDLFGNVWKLDVTSTNKSSWDFAYKSGSTPVPVFSASTDQTSSKPQPITTRIQAANHPQGYGGFMLYFGTGQYIENDDSSQIGQNTQTFYGIWDRNENSLETFNRDDLLQQSITVETTINGTDYRITTDNDITWHNQDEIDQLENNGDIPNGNYNALSSVPTDIVTPIKTHLGWYLDLYNTESGNTNNYGERQVTDAVLRVDRVVFTTLIPSDSACDFGGSGWLMELDLENGGRLPVTPFDVNNDNVFSSLDYYDPDPNVAGDEIPVSGRKSKVGIIPTPGILSDPKNKREFKYESGSSGNIEVVLENPGATVEGRQSWIELFQ